MKQTDSGWRKRQIALEKMAENARELGLDYEPDKTVVEMAREAWAKAGEGWVIAAWFDDRAKAFEAFAALIRADERNRTWTPSEWTEYERSIAATEREACAKVCDDIHAEYEAKDVFSSYAEAIRARGQA